MACALGAAEWAAGLAFLATARATDGFALGEATGAAGAGAAGAGAGGGTITAAGGTGCGGGGATGAGAAGGSVTGFGVGAGAVTLTVGPAAVGLLPWLTVALKTTFQLPTGSRPEPR